MALIALTLYDLGWAAMIIIWIAILYGCIRIERSRHGTEW
jgi:hypothetical protein